MILDPDYNVHYTNATGIPLSAIDLYQMSQDSMKIKDIKPVTGKSPNTLHNEDSNLVELFYKNGVAINYYNRWVDKNLPRTNPARSPVIMGYYIGNSKIERLYYKNGSDVITDEVSSKLYTKPSEQ